MRVKSFRWVTPILFILVLGFALGSCGGSSSSNDPPPDPTTGTISGTVAGTEIIAVNDADEIVANVTAGTTPDLSGNYPFTLTGIPVDTNIRVYLITDSGVYPLYFDSAGGTTNPDTNVFSLTAVTTIDLGFVDTAMVGQDGRAIPGNNPVDVAGVDAQAENTTIPASAFLVGNWNLHLLVSGDSPQWTGWVYGAMGVDGAGNLTVSSLVNNDGAITLPPSSTMNVSADGTVTTTAVSSYHRTLSQDAELIVATQTDRDGGYILSVLQKAGATYAVSDMAGTWNYVGLISGDATDQTPGWYWGAMTADGTGAVTSATTITDSLGNSDYTPSIGGAISLGSDGIINYPVPGSGAMNRNKDMIVSVLTMAPGSIDAVSGYNLQIGIKAGGSFTTADMAGDWVGHLLTSGDSPQYTGWAYFKTTIDTSGNSTWTEVTRSNGDSTLPSGPIAFSLSSGGILSVTAVPSIHGVMTQDKRTLVVTMTDGGGGYNLMIMQKK